MESKKDILRYLLKLTVFIEVLGAVVFGCVWAGLKILGQDCPIIVLPILSSVLFGAVVLGILISPVARWIFK